ncbi:glycosyltransferase [Paenibacillus sp. GCM10028914]|uniref:glycosyltransferase n=1 Tax=Paenibacillus sp. GCM10028914 TaxID=3273416 RepID=UPI0036D337C6
MHVSLGLPPLRTGGLTKYSMDLMLTQQRMDQEISLLYPGHYTLQRNLHIQKNDSFHDIEVYEIVNPLPVSLLGGVKKPEEFMKLGNREPYERLLYKVKPDIIHMHTFMGIHKQFLEVAKELGIKIVFTSHDYFGICPKVNLLNHEGKACESFQYGQACIACNQNGYSSGMMYMMQSRVYRRFKNSHIVKHLRKKIKQRVHPAENGIPDGLKSNSSNPVLASLYAELRNYYLEMYSLIDRIHFNSSISQQEYSKYISNQGDIISLRHRNMKDRRSIKPFQKDHQPLRLTYLGPVDVYKGFFLLKDSLDLLESWGISSWHLNVYGDATLSDEDYNVDRYTFHGRYEYEDLAAIFNHTDLLIIPSIWKETFGFIGMEALAYGVPILITDQVGFKDLIHDGLTGFIAAPEVNDLASRMRYILENRRRLEEINQNIIAMEIDFSMEQHTKDLIQWYSTVREEVRI